jgi:hypothetical protein
VLNLCGTCYGELQVLGWIYGGQGRDAEEFGVSCMTLLQAWECAAQGAAF